MKNFFCILLALMLCFETMSMPVFANSNNNYDFSAGIGHAVLASSDPDDYDNNEVFIMYADGTSEVVTYENKASLSNALQELSQSDEIEILQPNYSYSVAGSISSDTFSDRQWALFNDGSFALQNTTTNFPIYERPFSTPFSPGKFNRSDTTLNTSRNFSISAVKGIDINIRNAWNIASTGKKEREVLIAFIDTGVYTNHMDFDDVFWVNADEIAGNGIDDDHNGYIDDVNGWNFFNDNNFVYTGNEDAHGTHGAGSIAASKDNEIGIAGIAADSNVKIMVLKSLGGSDGSGTTQDVIDAIKYAQAEGASICNLSMGADAYDTALYNVMADSNMLFVVSAGNEGSNNDLVPNYPANYNLDNIISVANLQADGTLHPSSNYGKASVDIAVPGTNILSLTTGNTYAYMTGTSMSAPILSAVLAMMYAYSPEISLLEMKNIICETAKPLASLNDKTLYSGMLDAGAAMEKLYEIKQSTQQYNSSLPFKDLSSDNSSYNAIEYLYNRGIMIGTGETTFSPDETLTRAMAVTLLGRIAYSQQVDTDSFLDVSPGTWYSGYVGWAVENAIIFGYGNGYFGTNDEILAEQLNLMLERYALSLGFTYDSDLAGDNVLTRAQTAQELYDFCIYRDSINL